MATPSPSGPESPAPSAPKVCYLSRKKGWTDPDRPRRAVSEVNLLAVYLGSPVWTLETAWAAVFGSLIPLSVARAYRTASSRSRLTDDEVRVLREVADRLRVELRILD